MKRLRRKAVSTYVTTDRAGIYYLSGFTGEDSALVVSSGGAVLVTDRRFEEQAACECLETRAIMRDGGLAAAVAEELPKRGKIGYDPRTMTVGMLEELGRGRRGRFKAVGDVVRRLRQIKSEAEARAISQALQLAAEAFRRALSEARAGWSERKLAALLDYEMRRGGADGSAFDTVALVDERASLPHGRPGSRRIEPGSSVLVDWGARSGAYSSDLTRVIAAGRLTATVRKLYGIVCEAQERAIERIRPGVTASAVDAEARTHIERSGYGEHFGHGLGHGVGLEVHELPVLSPRSKVRLRKGMVFSVEPGIYIPGKAGVRVEDLVMVTGDGCRRLASLSRRVVQLGK